ncbi:hypothetical protein OROMI_009148 [Orobanche minor]
MDGESGAFGAVGALQGVRNSIQVAVFLAKEQILDSSLLGRISPIVLAIGTGAMEKGGVGALELVVMDIKARGMYVHRTLSYKGAEFEVVEVTLDANMMNVSATVMALPAPKTGGRLFLLLKLLHDGVETSSCKRAKMRSSASKSDPNSLSHINVGDVIHGRIRRVDSYGLFISIDHTNVSEGSS